VPLRGAGGRLLSRAFRPGRAPPRDQVIGVHQPDVDRRAEWDAPPLDDAPVQVGRRLAHLLLGAELPCGLRQPLDLSSQRSGVGSISSAGTPSRWA
jgi:hypothetical protein